MTTTLVSCKVPTYLLGWLQLMTKFGVLPFPHPSSFVCEDVLFFSLKFYPLSPAGHRIMVCM
ncbi:hypothetical protein M747DRAFT_15834 [Aspergillus niger ATCC 13496]|uniref:Uncharacterized protein n=1 Tax=Aspergillus niger ATCC 13496 TaxID=1353008 RepID=A0A370C1S4_ASPNG|nr:hypothetical protein M747DRAFT_15834 [Aspergillus niger ATCC 13496]